MFRENVLTKDDIIDRIATTMIPVAVDRWKAEDSRTKEARFLQPFFGEHPATGSPCIYSPDGEVLGGFNGFHNMAERTRTLIEEALTAFGAVKLRDVPAVDMHPYRGKGVMPDGSVQLAEYVRPSESALKFMNTVSPVISSVSLTEKEFNALAPEDAAAVGTKWTLPDAVAKRFSRITSPMCYQHAPQPEWVTAARITAEVQTIGEGVVTLQYEGRIASEHEVGGRSISVQEATLTGEGLYDPTAKTMRSLILVGSGFLTWDEAPEKRVAFDVLVEWVLSADPPVGG